MSIKIYFDMDGVLADFDRAAQQFACPGQLNLNKATRNMSLDAVAQKRARWHAIESDRNFWANIPVMDGIFALLDAAAKCGELYVLTSVPGAKNFAGGVGYVDYVESEKRAWIARNMSMCFDDKHVIVARIAKEKRVPPTKNDILIDDRVENIADWIAAGGQGIVFTSPAQAIQAIKDLTFVNL